MCLVACVSLSHWGCSLVTCVSHLWLVYHILIMLHWVIDFSLCVLWIMLHLIIKCRLSIWVIVPIIIILVLILVITLVIVPPKVLPIAILALVLLALILLSLSLNMWGVYVEICDNRGAEP